MVNALQALRALSAWMVVYHHYMQIVNNFQYQSAIGDFFVNYGAIGVDVFFIISGFIMYHSLTLKPRTPKTFFMSRLKRIVPVYWFYTCLTILVMHFCHIPVKYVWTYQSLLKSIMFIPHENPAGLGIFPLLTVGWTLNFEMFFYSILALNLWLFRRYAFTVTAIICLLLPLIWQKTWLWAAICSSDKLTEFSLGILLGYCYGQVSLKLWDIKSGLFCVLWLLLITLGQKYLNTYAIVPVILALTVERVVNWQHWFFKCLLSLGNMSYSTYLAHTVVIFGVTNFISKPVSSIAEIILIFCLTLIILAISTLSYRYIENNPFTITKINASPSI